MSDTLDRGTGTVGDCAHDRAPQELAIVTLQAQAGEARRYQPLLAYLETKGVRASFVTAPSYPAAADMFAAGGVDALFGGSGVAG